MKFSLVRKVKAPIRGHATDAGIDFYVPEFTKQFLFDLADKNEQAVLSKGIEFSSDSILLQPHSRILIPSGVHVNLEDLATRIVNNSGLSDDELRAGIALIVHNKSGVGSKMGLDRLAEVIDESYQGEVHLNIVNTGNEPIIIKPNTKLVQMLLVPVFYSKPIEVPFEELYKKESDRGAGGFGSTDKQ